MLRLLLLLLRKLLNSNPIVVAGSAVEVVGLLLSGGLSVGIGLVFVVGGGVFVGTLVGLVVRELVELLVEVREGIFRFAFGGAVDVEGFTPAST